MVNYENQLNFSVKVKTHWFPLIFVFIWTLGCVASIAVILYGIRTTPSRIESGIMTCLVIIFLVLLASNYMRWQLTGKENIIISNTGIEIFKSGTWFSKRLKLAFFEFEGIQVSEDKKTSFTRKFYGIGGGKVVFHYLGRNRRFGQDMTFKEAKKIVNRIKTEISSRGLYRFGMINLGFLFSQL